MSSKLLVACGIVFLLVGSREVHATELECEPTDNRHALKVTRSAADHEQVWFTRLLLADATATFSPAEIYGEHTYRRELETGWIFVLLRQQAGWSLRLYDKEPSLGGVDMSSITPPYSAGVPNTRDIVGWHFRNKANTAANRGDVNAPQHLRPFAFSRSLIGTGGFKPSTNPSEPTLTAPDDDGRGWLRVLDFGLADLTAGQTARMNYLKFDACLVWPKSEQEISDAEYLSTIEYLDEEIENFGSCGLDLQSYRLNARAVPRQLAGDLDGDGSVDELVQVIDRATGRQDIALCRAGTWHHILGQLDGAPVFQHALSALERWRLVPGDFAEPGEVGGETQWPAADGDVLVLERIEKSMHLVFMHNGKLLVRRVYHVVEP